MELFGVLRKKASGGSIRDEKQIDAISIFVLVDDEISTYLCFSPYINLYQLYMCVMRQEQYEQGV